MDTKWKSYSHSITTKIITFIIVIVCFTGAITTFLKIISSHNFNFNTIFEDSYYYSENFTKDSHKVIENLEMLTFEFKSEEYVLKGGLITEDRIKDAENNLYEDFKNNSKNHNVNLSEEENHKKFKEVYAEKISQIKDKLIQKDLEKYNSAVQGLKEVKGVIYYVSDGKNSLSNTDKINVVSSEVQSDIKEYFKSFQSYMLFDKSEENIYPKDIKNSKNYNQIKGNVNAVHAQNTVMYIGFSNEYLNPAINEWKENKAVMNNYYHKIQGFSIGLLLSFAYLVIIIGRKSFKDKEINLNTVDRLYNDINLGLCLGIIALWIVSLESTGVSNINNIIIEITAILAALGLTLVLSLVKHFKNKTIIKHSLIYTMFHKIFKFAKDVYNNGSTAVKVVLIVIGYPALIALTFFMFPVTIGAATWLAFKKVKEFNAIKEGIEKVKNGDINYKINLATQGELGKLASSIDSITEGLNEAVESQLKSERLKTELITNVSHDIRTPLTSIITYVELLKKEEDKSKAQGYIEILEQKAQRLKILTEDLFEASKASSGNIPVNYEKIEVISLITQGLGELNDKVKKLKLQFKMNFPKEKVYVKADGKLLWRVIENLLSNIFKYALEGSRVYIDIESLEREAIITIKNISAYELNISAQELMERFKRGDESRSSEGSGLGLSIAKSLVQLQNGSFAIEIDGDLFKAIIKMPME